MEKPYSSLFTLAELLAMQKDYERKQAAERDRKLAEMQAAHGQAERERAAVPEKKFVYRPRDPLLWDARANQQRQRPTYRGGSSRFTLSAQDRARFVAKVEILHQVIEEWPDATVAELATASGMSESWVRKHRKEK
jgi:hypothetical protein